VREWIEKIIQAAFDGLVAKGEFVPLGLHDRNLLKGTLTPADVSQALSNTPTSSRPGFGQLTDGNPATKRRGSSM
jgi:hypothetical protein